MATQSDAVTPMHLWVFAIASLLWNCVGAYDYTMTYLQGLAYFESAGLDAAAFAWFQRVPIWVKSAYAVGVWGSILGSILLLLRSRQAVIAFALSLIGAIINFAYQFASDPPVSMHTGAAVVMPIVILLLVVVQWYYARRMTAAGVLR
jgi:hypothetical protein